MNINAEGLALVKKYEGFEATPYQDAADKWTVGWGHLIRPGESFTSVTQAQADQLLQDDLADDEEAVSRMVSVPLNENQYSALVSFTFNVGAGNFRGSNLRAYVNQRAWQQAADEFGRWVHANGRELPGLVARRAAERALFLKPVIVADNGPVNV